MKRTFAALARHARLASSRKRERALVLVPHEGGVADAYLIDQVRESHELRVTEERKGVAWSELAPLHPLAVPYLPPVVIATPPQDVITLATTIEIERANPQVRMQATEFQEVLKKLQVSLWAEHRPRIAEKLGVDAIDAVLVSFRVESVRVEGAEVLNPHELVGSHVELDVSVRFVSRDTFERAREAAPVPFFADPAWMLVSGHDPVAPAVLLAQSDPAVLVTAASGKRGLREASRLELEWTASDITRELELRWALSPKAAAGMLARFAEGAAHGSVDHAIAASVAAPREALDRELRAARVSSPLVTVADIRIPPSSGRGSIELIDLDPALPLRASGLELAEGAPDALVLAAFAEFYYNERYSKLNAWLRQRIAWLGSAGTH